MADQAPAGSPKHSARDQAIADRIKRQKKVFTNWVNYKLCERDDNIMVTDLFEDIKDGFVMHALLEELSGQSLRPLGKMTKGKLRIQHVANMNIVFKYLEQTVKIVGIGPQDIVDGNETLVLGMLWSTIVFFMAKDLGGIDDMSALKSKILRWVKKHTDPYEDLDITNLTSDFASGTPFLAILNNVNPSGSPYNPSDDPVDNLKRAFKDAHEKYGVPMLIDPEDPDFWKDEKAMIPQLAEFMKRLPDDVADKDTIADQGMDNWTKANKDKLADDLGDLCAIPSVADDPDHIQDCDAAANKVKDLMTDAGMDNVTKEDGPAPFVFADKMVGENKPTVLIYANYGVSEPDDPAGGSWDGKPFEPVVDADRMTAKGVAEDKSHVLAPINAVKAIMDTVGANGLPVNVKVVVGGVPPPTSKFYDPSNNTQKLKDFVNRNKDALMPDYILVSEPDGSLLAPGAAAGMFSCRGFVSFDVTATTFEDAATSPEEPFCSRYVGPFLDPAIVLAKAVGKLRGPDGKIAVAGLTGIDPELPAAIREAVSGITYGEAELRADSGYKAGAVFAQEADMTLAEQLCFSTGVSVVNLGGVFGEVEEATAPRAARVRVHANIPPTMKVDDAYTKLTAAIEANVGYGVAVEFSDKKGEPGWVSDPTHQFFKSVCESMGKQFAPKPSASAGNPEYKPIPAVFANCFGKPTYMHGVNDGERNIHHANESMALEDVRREIRGFVKTLGGLQGKCLIVALALALETIGRRFDITCHINVRWAHLYPPPPTPLVYKYLLGSLRPVARWLRGDNNRGCRGEGGGLIEFLPLLCYASPCLVQTIRFGRLSARLRTHVSFTI